MTDTRADFAGYAEAWASRADRYATDYREAVSGETGDLMVVQIEGLRDQAVQMALMWATVAALHPTEPDPSWGRKFFLNDGGTVDAGPLLSERVAAEQHGPCTASIIIGAHQVDAGTTQRCVLAAGHYVADLDVPCGPHSNRMDAADDSEGSIKWLDWAEGAVPHGARPEGSGGTAPS